MLQFYRSFNPQTKLAGMLSKAKGQILRVAAALHVLFNINTPLTIPQEISDAAIKAAVDLVDVCIQHAAFLARRGDVDETIQGLAEGTTMNVHVPNKLLLSQDLESFTMHLP